MPKTKPKTLPSDYLETALEATRGNLESSQLLTPSEVDVAVEDDRTTAVTEEPQADAPTKKASKPGRRVPPKRAKGEKVRMSFNLPAELCERARNTVSKLAIPPESLNLSKLAERTLERELKRLEKRYNGGKPFRKRRQIDLRRRRKRTT